MTVNLLRFLGSTPERDPQTLVFGFSRRICLGCILAELSIYLTIVMSLEAFNIRKSVRDDNGEEDDIQPRVLPGITSRPALFEMRATLRDLRYEGLVRSA